MSVLMELAAANGAVVSRDALIEKVWSGAHVSDHSVANAISELRRALGDDRANPTYIETISKRGYRLLAAATPVDDDIGPAAARIPQRRANMAALGGILAFFLLVALIFHLRPVFSAPTRIFLTDIENATGDPQWDIAAHALEEMLTVELTDASHSAGGHRLVRWRTAPVENDAVAAFSPNGGNLNPRDRIIEGTIILDGGEPTLTLQLIDTEDRASIWAGAWPIRGAGAFHARAVAAALSEPLGLPAATRVQDHPDARLYEAYWRARYLWGLRDHGSIRQALAILQKTTQDAPDFAPAHAALADIYAHKTAEELGLAREETYRLADIALTRALAIDPDLPEGLITQAYLSFFRDADATAAKAQIDRALKLTPQNALAWQTKAMIASAAGDFNQSLAAIDRARAIDPMSASILWDKVWFQYISGRHDDALSTAEVAKRLAAPVDVYEALIHLARGDDDAALDSWIARAGSRGAAPSMLARIAAIRAADGARPALVAFANDVANNAAYPEASTPLAALLIAVGDRDGAVQALLATPQEEKSWWRNWFGVMSAFDAVRADPRLAGYARV
jgi:Tfp pilus assembly protein PilF/TolB-like protein